MAWWDSLTFAQMAALPPQIKAAIFGTVVKNSQPSSISNTIFAPFHAADQAVASVAPALAPPSIPILNQAAAATAPAVAVTPTIIPGKTIMVEAAAAESAKKKRREIAIDDGISRGAAAAGAGLLGGDSGLPIDPLGRRGRGAVGHATLLGR